MYPIYRCFYVDSPENGCKNEMVVNTKYENEISDHLRKVSRNIVDFNNPKLTRVVLDKRDVSRRITLVQRTAQPKRRRLAISEYIQACLDEVALLDEDSRRKRYDLMMSTIG
jgi:DNA ligase-4